MTNQIIDEALASVAADAQPEAQNGQIDNQAPEGDEGQNQDGAPNNKAANDDDQPFPKKAVNALARRDRRIGQFQAREQQYLARIRELEGTGGNANQTRGNQPTKDSKAPKEDDFENYGDYLKAAAKYEVRQELEQQHAEQQKTTQQHAHQQQLAAWYHQKSEELATYTQEKLASDPELQRFTEEYGDVIDQIPESLEVVFLQFKPEEALAAARVLAEEGKLEGLFKAPPVFAAAEIARAASRGAATSKTKTISKAPAPMNANRGLGSSAKSIETMSADELLASVKG